MATECIYERTGHRWHLAGGGDSWWRAIRCSATEGVCLPGPPEDREPTCPACLALLPEQRDER